MNYLTGAELAFCFSFNIFDSFTGLTAKKNY